MSTIKKYRTALEHLSYMHGANTEKFNAAFGVPELTEYLIDQGYVSDWGGVIAPSRTRALPDAKTAFRAIFQQAAKEVRNEL